MCVCVQNVAFTCCDYIRYAGAVRTTSAHLVRQRFRLCVLTRQIVLFTLIGSGPVSIFFFRVRWNASLAVATNHEVITNASRRDAAGQQCQTRDLITEIIGLYHVK